MIFVDENGAGGNVGVGEVVVRADADADGLPEVKANDGDDIVGVLWQQIMELLPNGTPRMVFYHLQERLQPSNQGRHLCKVGSASLQLPQVYHHLSFVQSRTLEHPHMNLALKDLKFSNEAVYIQTLYLGYGEVEAEMELRVHYPSFLPGFKLVIYEKHDIEHHGMAMCNIGMVTCLKVGVQFFDPRSVVKETGAVKDLRISDPLLDFSLPEIDAGVVKNGIESDHTTTVPQAADETEQISKAVGKRATITTALANAGNSLEGAETELVLNLIRLAFESNNVKVHELALDCLHKLIAYDHLEGDPGLDGVKNVALFTDILNIVCSCVENSSSDRTLWSIS
ncbi:hypothetical protein RHGRI_014294 [Rhododendron griersonianum]|uniref:Uncharacterized protein n=1 Tax=Rhododendron griersonianum TaxID=479676 RepID=A0AAV6K9A3_9ERIC|nr:hypothetical protein RHGRI_014294 [Rhododendron griersonianum]